MERSKETPSLYHKISYDGTAIEKLLVDLFVESHKRAPEEIVLDLDATDDPLQGEPEGRFFHGYYDCYCYPPLYVFRGDHLPVAKSRKADIDGYNVVQRDPPVLEATAAATKRMPRTPSSMPGTPREAGSQGRFSRRALICSAKSR